MGTLDDSFKKIRDTLTAEPADTKEEQVIRTLTLAGVDVLEHFFKDVDNINASLRKIAAELPMIRGKI